MQQHETIHDRAETWRNNIERFINTHELTEHPDVDAFQAGFNAIIDGVIRESYENWTVDDETCPVCGSDCIYSIGTTVEGTKHSDGEVRTIWASNETTLLEIECCDCETVLMTSPAAAFCPVLSGEFPTEKSESQQTIHKGGVNDWSGEISAVRDMIGGLTTSADWKPGTKPVEHRNMIIIEVAVDAYPSLISNGTFHSDTIGERLTTLEYRLEGDDDPLQQSSTAVLVDMFSL